jgi:rRNA small subunit pseudouridine methyltransferase Nep1
LDYLIIEEASLELVPQEFRAGPEAISVKERFGVPSSMQILDCNFHPKTVGRLKVDQQKRGRPDVVHFALLDATSTPVFENSNLGVIVRTRDGHSIDINSKTRLPRTLQRFCGVMAKLLSRKLEEEEHSLFDVKENVSFSDLIRSLRIDKVISFTTQGKPGDLRGLVAEHNGDQNVAWVVGGFAHGHFREDVIQRSDDLISIANSSLPAHVVTARLTYEIERMKDSFP